MLKFLKKHLWIGLIGSLFMVCEVLIDLIQPRMMAQIVDNGILKGNTDLVWSVGIRMIFIVFLGGCCGILSGVFVNICSQHFGNDLRKALFDRIMNFSFEQIDDFTTGSLITRTTSDVTQVQTMVSQLIRGAVRCMMFFFAGSSFLLTLNVAFSRVLMFTIPIILAEIAFVVWKSGPMFTHLQTRLDRVNSVIGENIASERVVKAFVQEQSEIEKFDKSNLDLVNTRFEVQILISWMRPVMNIVLNAATVAIIYIGGMEVAASRMEIGSLMAAITYLSQILSGMMMMAMIFQTITLGLASAKRLKEVLASVPVIRDGDAKDIEKRGGSIEFKNVSFNYPGHHHEVLKDISFTVAPGQTLAVIGATGSGKSTLVSLIARFYDVTEGSVLVDGEDVKHFTLHELRDRISFVLQKSELFTGTIRKNIMIGNPEASEEEMIFAARAAQADEFILHQPDKYDTTVAEAGMSLSGGQKQRIAISRALLKPAEILILDDSTSALDLGTEARLFKALDEGYEKLTRIIIAQRIATVMRADRIAVMDKGRIVGIGSHNELMENCDVYREIYDSQLRKGDAKV
ncbi:ATP-binding cassette, subfamily B [Oribacterium sp. KHPX15]|uniref:ABC transporter ATP-binding protein n=1 Tax=Oribacterium sp. KHPX15 TaxID=1855342 RepID=UPI000899D23C|nr:ABC transporter ATP-binding protein [Oribacterium sp. KHPX15]SEA75903.1 ATP-binding cassette, subfamily B [Oribacterium sp. KHPX15]